MVLNTVKQFTVDVIIPTYNTGAYITEAIQSVIAQTYPIKSIIVVDDGSTDTTETIVESISKKTTTPIIYKKQNNQGPNAARNTGVQLSQATFIAFLDADDVWFPEKISEQISVYKRARYKNIGLVYCKYITLNKKSEPIKQIPIRPITPGIEGSCFEALLQGNEILASSSGVLLKREVFSTVGFFDESLRMAEDWDMWLRIAEEYDIDYTSKVLCGIRRHDTNSTRNTESVLLGEISFLNKWVPRIVKKYTIPKSWKQRIIGLVIKKRFSKILIRKIKQTLHPEVHAIFFKNEGNSIALSTLLFLYKKIWTKKFWKKLYNSIVILWNNR